MGKFRVEPMPRYAALFPLNQGLGNMAETGIHLFSRPESGVASQRTSRCFLILALVNVGG